MNQSPFKPTPEMIRAAEMLFVAIAIEDDVRERVQAYERAILEAREYRVSDELRAIMASNGHEAPEDRITTPQRAAWMDAADREDFLARCRDAADAAGMTPKPPYDCPLIEAEATRRLAEQHLLDCMESLAPKVAKAQGELRKRAIDASLRLLAPHTRDAVGIMASFGSGGDRRPAPGL